MRVARLEAVGDAPASLVEHDILTSDHPLAGEGPVVDAQAVGELVGATLTAAGTETALTSKKPSLFSQ